MWLIILQIALSALEALLTLLAETKNVNDMPAEQRKLTARVFKRAYKVQQEATRIGMPLDAPEVQQAE